MALQLNLDASLATPLFSRCNGTACFIFSRLVPGTTVSVIGDSGTPYGPATFVKFDSQNCAVTLRETTTGTPGFTTTTVIDCTKIESVSFTS